MEKEIVFCQSHIDFYMDDSGLSYSHPIFSISGNMKSGKPLQVLVRNFFPYFYIEAANGKEYRKEDIKESIQRLDVKATVLEVEAVMKQTIMGYTEGKKTFYKVTLNTPHASAALRAFLEGGVVIKGEKVRFRVYESGFPFVLRFMCDLGIVGMSYLKVNSYEVLDSENLTLSTSYESLETLPLTGVYAILPPLKILSIDIECVSAGNSFPSSKSDPIIQIGNTLMLFGNEKHESQAIFCLKETTGIPGASVHWYDTEKGLLESWKKYFMEVDPDIIVGYNIKGFDLPYILDRGEILGINDFSILGRSKKKAKTRDTTMSSNMFGSITTTEVEIDGRLIIDMMVVIRRDYKLRSYSLNSVSIHFLKEQKEDVPPSSIGELQSKDKDSRRRIASYCLRDTVLPLRLFSTLSVLINYTELSRVTGVPIDYFFTRGTAIKMFALIYRVAAKEDFVVPEVDPFESNRTFEGGFVIEPKRGFYNKPVSVMDFTSLYPSIMISNNLCYTTLLTKEQYRVLGGIRTPTDNYFCSAERKKGLLPRILVDLLESRKKIKEELKKEKDPALKACLNGRQLAVKLCANSLYGFTGASKGKLPCFEISQSVTGFGREMINFTKNLIEENFSKKNGYTHDSVVIYGDTDSVMIDFNEEDLGRVFEMSKRISEFVTSKFVRPVSLEFEKVYYPYLLINKKRYAGLLYSNPDSPSKIDTRGIETVRRDNCGLVKEAVETVLEMILYQRNVEKAKRFVKDVVRDLYLGKIDLSLLVISKSLTKAGDKYGSRQAHVELAEKLRKRDESTAPVLGDRVPYVIVKKGKGIAAYEKSEDPVYVLENNLPIDTEYYIEQQLSKPLKRIFDPIMDNVHELFKGDHTRVMQSTSLKGPINTFLKPADVCIGCRAEGRIICSNCTKDFHVHLQRMQREVEDKKERLNGCWVECQRCQGSIHNQVLCVNRDCPIFYMRTKVKKELIPLSEKLGKLRSFSW
ncbi:DNA polymerase type-B delta catalytic subunit [Encephalitozoon hellem ATCC 50504]|uniref:DNA polymerase n=1 Tax=Encephalitozoon hellem TaxID=27973 RepID=A0A9Q9CB35_ENCHE|nr:DNA polymerase type-B delta catalytic subunit [Encephalitozoon hellem ATCC 50504]AFM98938.1 DNA polymerase type-B delta catalytic subunit [Encephalitozoon hellem ATCC 50504]UTX43952.1 DNA polymerase delta catalytic subunit [Encephalitozoon hellem]WEL39436.1 DNA polymerase delta catalytic subunit [Encephalitozoon hellem]|eukprot:XP_003887919.1 DNA polymerase type-B delta catalytic subunit [Encephalitozoon hellem ATCC 50504]